MAIALTNHGPMNYDIEPDICPLCGKGAPVKEKTNSLAGAYGSSSRTLEIVFKCPWDQCGRLFMARYKCVKGDVFRILEIVPSPVVVPHVDIEIDSVSPMYGKILSQAAQAEAHGLDLIAGPGYRKALEFLVKDYCCGKHPDKQDEIRAALLGKVIEQWVTDPSARECSRRAAWLGNDETHYERRWTDKDIEDLKMLIQLAAAWMKHEMATHKYLSTMPQKQKDSA